MANAVTYSYSGPTFDQTLTSFDNPNIAGSYSASNFVSGSFTLATALGADTAATDISGILTSYSFSDGKNTLDNTNSVITYFDVATSGGVISDWRLRLSSKSEAGAFTFGPNEVFKRIITQSVAYGVFDQGFEMTCLVQSCSRYTSGNDARQSANRPANGTWTSDVSTVPLPASALLLLAGLGGMGAVARRARRRA